MGNIASLDIQEKRKIVPRAGIRTTDLLACRIVTIMLPELLPLAKLK
jgi:hypothetical protein